MARTVRVTVLSPTGGEYQQTIEVADDYELPTISDRDDWVEIESEHGGVWALPPRALIAVVLEDPKGTKTKRKRGGRIN